MYEKDDKVTVGIFMLYFFRIRLNEAYIANVPFAKSARTFICRFIFSLKVSSDFAFLISQRTFSHILGAREDVFCSTVHCAVSSPLQS